MLPASVCVCICSEPFQQDRFIGLNPVLSALVTTHVQLPVRLSQTTISSRLPSTVDSGISETHLVISYQCKKKKIQCDCMNFVLNSLPPAPSIKFACAALVTGLLGEVRESNQLLLE